MSQRSIQDWGQCNYRRRLWFCLWIQALTNRSRSSQVLRRHSHCHLPTRSCSWSASQVRERSQSTKEVHLHPQDWSYRLTDRRQRWIEASWKTRRTWYFRIKGECVFEAIWFGSWFCCLPASAPSRSLSSDQLRKGHSLLQDSHNRCRRKLL